MMVTTEDRIETVVEEIRTHADSHSCRERIRNRIRLSSARRMDRMLGSLRSPAGGAPQLLSRTGASSGNCKPTMMLVMIVRSPKTRGAVPSSSVTGWRR